MHHQEETTVSCPYCGEVISIIIDCTGIGQEYIEDCQVCCRPITFQIRHNDNHTLDVIVKHENE